MKIATNDGVYKTRAAWLGRGKPFNERPEATSSCRWTVESTQINQEKTKDHNM